MKQHRYRFWCGLLLIPFLYCGVHLENTIDIVQNITAKIACFICLVIFTFGCVSAIIVGFIMDDPKDNPDA